MRSGKKKFLKITGIVLLTTVAAVVLFAGSLMAAIAAQGHSAENQCVLAQRERMTALKAAYRNNTAPKADEASVLGFDLSASENLPYNRLRTIGTHNSYKLRTTGAMQFVSKTLFPVVGASPNAFEYDHDTLTEQLNLGVRSLELDLSFSKREGEERFTVQHSPLFDGNSSAIDLILALEEIAEWSRYNEGHIPITVLLEVKEDFLMKAGSRKLKESDFSALYRTVSDTLGDRLLTPSEMWNGEATARAVREKNAYPALRETLGKVIVILHPGKFTDTLASVPLSEQKLFVMANLSERENYAETALFVLGNRPGDEADQASKEGFIVRTRLDDALFVDEARAARAIEGRAQILSTDFPPRKNPSDLPVSIFPNGKTIALLD